MTRILLVRHGHVPGIEPGRFRGRSDLPLTEFGLQQARATAAAIHARWQPARVYSSPLQRCVVTAQLIAGACGVDRQTCNELIDLDYGSWQDRSFEEVRRSSPQAYAHWLDSPELHRFPSGESLAMLAARVTEALRAVLQAHPTQTVVLVGHDSTNRALLLLALGLPLHAYRRIRQDPCGLSEFVVEADAFHVQRVNETAHLLGLPQSAGQAPS